MVVEVNGYKMLVIMSNGLKYASLIWLSAAWVQATIISIFLHKQNFKQQQKHHIIAGQVEFLTKVGLTELDNFVSVILHSTFRRLISKPIRT